MKNKTKNTMIFSIEVSIYAILSIVFFSLFFVDINVNIVNIIYISFISISFGWMFASGFIFTKTDNAVHNKMQKGKFVPTNYSLSVNYKRRGLIGVIVIWLIYFLVIGIFKFLGLISWQLFLMGACAMFILNSIFTRKFCLLSVLFLHNKYNCCKYCGINAWDYLIFSSALIFAPKISIFTTILNICIIVFSCIIFILWEHNYRKHPERFYPETNANLSCKNCLKHCKWKN